LLYLAFWYGLAAVAFWLLGFETRGRTFEDIDASLAVPTTVAVGGDRRMASPS
jgi:hypothetical protein